MMHRRYRASDRFAGLTVWAPNINIFRDPYSPLSALVGFKRIHLKKGEQKTLRFTLDSAALSSVYGDGVRSMSPGPATLWIGGGQQKVREGLLAPTGKRIEFTIGGQ